MKNDRTLNETSFTIKFKCASYDKLPTEDNIVNALVEGIQEDFPNITSDIKISTDKN